MYLFNNNFCIYFDIQTKYIICCEIFLQNFKTVQRYFHNILNIVSSKKQTKQKKKQTKEKRLYTLGAEALCLVTKTQIMVYRIYY